MEPKKKPKNDVSSLNVPDAGTLNNVMAEFCVNKFPPMTATYSRPTYHKSVKAYS